MAGQADLGLSLHMRSKDTFLCHGWAGWSGSSLFAYAIKWHAMKWLDRLIWAFVYAIKGHFLMAWLGWLIWAFSVDICGKGHCLMARQRRLICAFVVCFCNKYISLWYDCAGWSGPSLFAYDIRTFSYDTIWQNGPWAFVVCICDKDISIMTRLDRLIWPSFSAYAIKTFSYGTDGQAYLGHRCPHMR